MHTFAREHHFLVVALTLRGSFCLDVVRELKENFITTARLLMLEALSPHKQEQSVSVILCWTPLYILFSTTSFFYYAFIFLLFFYHPRLFIIFFSD